MALRERVAQELAGERLPAAALAERLRAPRHEVNGALYELLEAGAVAKNTSAPLWGSVAPATVPGPLVLVDLGNVHDCLRELVPLCHAGAVTVRAYADLAYAGHGVAPPLDVPGLSVHQAPTADRNAADVELVWDLSRITAAADARDERLRVLVATKDQGFRRLESLARSAGHELTIVTSWPELRCHVE